ncbi:MAG: histidine phosphatase family protein [Candidatus Protistobacter heckmanni]|nr:histidine phosphatase family protein [Candidatus Protistobacter heckmanni]
MRRWDEIPRAEIDAWNADLEHAAPHGGESLAQFSRLLLDWHARMHAEGGAPRRDAGPAAVGTTGAVTERSAGAAGSAEDSEAGAVIIVAHAGVIRVLGAAILDLPLDRVVRWKLDFDGVCAFREGKLVCWNA